MTDDPREVEVARGPVIAGSGIDHGTPQNVLDLIATQIKDDIDAYCKAEGEKEDRRHHLGASSIGGDCSRKIWYEFRWVHQEIFNGRMHRLFKRGHDEEAKIVALLRAIGFVVWEVEPATGKQFRIYGASRHSGGSGDGIAWAPAKYKLPDRFLLEFKTHNYKSFSKLLTDRVRLAKPMHWVQMCNYGSAYGFDIGVYVAVNKNDDDVHIEVLKLDHRHGDDYAAKADDIIKSAVPPPKVALRADHWECKLCHLAGVCHRGEPYEINCRSCAFAQPIDGGTWYCHRHKGDIPKDFLPKGCPSHHEIGR